MVGLGWAVVPVEQPPNYRFAGFISSSGDEPRTLLEHTDVAFRGVAYSDGCRTLIPISVGQHSDFSRTPFRFVSDSVPG